MAAGATSPSTPIRYGTPAGRWVLAAAVLGSGVAFLDSTVVNVALPTIRADLHASVSGLQWTLDAYLVSLTALLLLGGSLGDVMGRRRVFVSGLVGFVAASLLCGVAPNTAALIAARALQGVAAAFLVPGSLAIISASFHPADRSRAVGAWSGLAGVATALGPFLGGWLIDAVSWRLIFLINLPLSAAAVWIAVRHVPETRDENAGRPDLAGAMAASVGLAGLTYGLIERNSGGPTQAIAVAIGVVGLVLFITVERATSSPMLPLELFRSRQFTGANLTTFAVYAGLGGALFLLALQLQLTLRYSAVEAGASFLPFTVLMLLLSPRAGGLAQRVGPRLPMTIGPIVAGGGLLLFARIRPGTHYLSTALPAVVVFGLGMTLTVAPLTAAVLAAVEDRHLGAGSGVNNAVARLAGLIAVAVLPGIAGISTGGHGATNLAGGYPTAMRIGALTCAVGGLVAFATIRTARAVKPTRHADLLQCCHEPALAETEAA